MSEQARKRKLTRLATSLVVVGAMIIVLMNMGATVASPTRPSNGPQIGVHSVCTLGSEVQTVDLWTPAILVNAPYLGSATALYTNGQSSSSSISIGIQYAQFSSTTSTTAQYSQQVNVAGGEATGGFFLYPWNLYQTKSLTQPGEGEGNPCTTAYAAQISGTGNWIAYSPISIQINGVYTAQTSDANEAHTVVGDYAGTQYGSVNFDNSYSSSNIGAMDTCNNNGGIEGSSNTQTTSVSMSVTFTYNGGVTLSGSYTQTTTLSTSFSYSFPTGYDWLQDQLGTSSPVAGLAFDWENNC